MTKRAILCAIVCLFLTVVQAYADDPTSPLDFTVDSIAGRPIGLSAFRGKVILIVNVASECRNTPQYKGLEELYKKYQDQGFTILGFPANVRGREPGTNEEIAKFCATNYRVDFPLFSKIVVQGEDLAPLYNFLTSPKTNPGHAGPIERNFEKFLIGRNGQVVARFATEVLPDAKELVDSIEHELAQK